MAHHKSAQKRIRQIEKRRLHNRYFKKTTRNMIKKLRHSHSKPEAEAMLPG
ncbi:MAG TPA: 30S ribosomal protein S20, partial [Chitinophagales bacterium]|nr:30S ribosomal protein S20 [Chitinophagales bacterium]